MKALFLNCSPRENGFTKKLLECIRDGISKDVDLEWVDVNKLHVKPCLGCFKCMPDKECIQEMDDAHIIGRKINEADFLIIGSPTYWGNMTGPLKTLFDRLMPVFEYFVLGELAFPRPRQKGKKAVIVTSSNMPWPLNHLSDQSRMTIKAIKRILKSGGYKIHTINYAGAYTKGMLVSKTAKKAYKLGEGLK